MTETKHRGIYIREGKDGPSYAISYCHPITGQRVRKVLKAASVWTFEPDGVDFGQIVDPIAFE